MTVQYFQEGKLVNQLGWSRSVNTNYLLNYTILIIEKENMNPKMEIERLSELVARLEKDLNCKGISVAV